MGETRSNLGKTCLKLTVGMGGENTTANQAVAVNSEPVLPSEGLKKYYNNDAVLVLCTIKKPQVTNSCDRETNTEMANGM